MTAEVALLNKHAVALAADSAVTVTGPRGNKIYNAANKLFALSKWQPVAVMVYGSAEYMGIPWETVIKMHREELGTKSFDRLEEYFDHLMKFLGENDVLFGEQAQEAHVGQVAARTFNDIKAQVRKTIEALTRVDPEKPISAEDIQNIVSQSIHEHYGACSRKELGLNMDVEHEEEVRRRYKDAIDRIRVLVLERLPLSEADENALRECVVLSLTRQAFLPETPGVVVAGFGDLEHFPTVCSATVQGRVAGRLKREPTSTDTIDNDTQGMVVPFAQIDAVQLFIEGIEPAHARFSTKLVSKTLEKFMEAILASLDMSDEDKATAKVEWAELAKSHWREFSEEAKKARTESYILPLLDVISVLPKDELAAVAEALVNITTLRRKVSMDAETVGGPIDVAVISKGDGLVWIQRKHYFKPELNPHFFQKYFRDRSTGGSNGA